MEASLVAVADAASGCVPDVRAGGDARTDRLEHGRPRCQLVGEWRSSGGPPPRHALAASLLEQRLDVHEVAVVADERTGTVGVGADDREAGEIAGRGSTPSFSSNTMERRAIASATSDSSVAPGRAPTRVAALTSAYGCSKMPEAELHPQHPLDGRAR